MPYPHGPSPLRTVRSEQWVMKLARRKAKIMGGDDDVQYYAGRSALTLYRYQHVTKARAVRHGCMIAERLIDG